MSVDRKVKRNAEKKANESIDLTDPIDELSSIIEEATPVTDIAKEQSDNVKSLIVKLKEKGAPDATIGILNNITGAIDKELSDIRDARAVIDKIKIDGHRNQEEAFANESTAINKAAIVMQAILNLQTMMTDLERIKKNSLDPTTGDA